MKIRQGFVSNSSTSSYIYMAASISNLTETAMKKMKELNCLYIQGDKYYFAKQIYTGWDDSFYFTDYEEVKDGIDAYLNLYNQYKDEFGLGDVKMCNDVAYDERWFKSVAEMEHNAEIDKE